MSFVQSSAGSISNLVRCYHSNITLSVNNSPRHQCPKSMESENPRLGLRSSTHRRCLYRYTNCGYFECTAEPPWPWYRTLKACRTRYRTYRVFRGCNFRVLRNAPCSPQSCTALIEAVEKIADDTKLEVSALADATLSQSTAFLKSLTPLRFSQKSNH